MADFRQMIEVATRKVTSHGEGAPLVRMDAKWLQEAGVKVGDTVALCRLPDCPYLIVVPKTRKRKR